MESLRGSLEKFQFEINITESKANCLRKRMLELSIEIDNIQHKLSERKYTLERNSNRLENLNKQVTTAERRREDLSEQRIAYEQCNQNHSQQLTRTNDAYISSLKKSRDLNMTLEQYNMEIIHLKRNLQQFKCRIDELENNISHKSNQKQIFERNLLSLKEYIYQAEYRDSRESYELDGLSLKVKQLSQQLELVTNNTREKLSNLDQSKKEYERISHRVESVLLEIEEFDKNIFGFDYEDEKSTSSLSNDQLATSAVYESRP